MRKQDKLSANLPARAYWIPVAPRAGRNSLEDAYYWYRTRRALPAHYAMYLARGERWAADHGVTAEWEDDGDNIGFYMDEPHEAWCSLHRRENYESPHRRQSFHEHTFENVYARYGEHVASVGGYLDVDRPTGYRREVEAEMYADLRASYLAELATEYAAV